MEERGLGVAGMDGRIPAGINEARLWHWHDQPQTKMDLSFDKDTEKEKQRIAFPSEDLRVAAICKPTETQPNHIQKNI